MNILNPPKEYALCLFTIAGRNPAEAKNSLGAAIQRFKPIPLSYWIEVATEIAALIEAEKAARS